MAPPLQGGITVGASPTVPTNIMNRYFQGQLRCEDSCLFGRTEQEVHTLIGVIHDTLSKDVLGHPTDGWISVVETNGSCGPVIARTIAQSVSVRSHITHPYQMLWASIYFDDDVGYFRPRFLNKSTIKEILQ